MANSNPNDATYLRFGTTDLDSIFAVPPKLDPSAFNYTGSQLMGIHAKRSDLARQYLTYELTGDSQRDYAEMSYIRGGLAALDSLLLEMQQLNQDQGASQ